jgi:hypothetical protein
MKILFTPLSIWHIPTPSGKTKNRLANTVRKAVFLFPKKNYEVFRFSNSGLKG